MHFSCTILLDSPWETKGKGTGMKHNLKALRKANGFTQSELADRIGATRRQVSAWERGESDLPMDYAFTIADVFDCTLDDIAGRVKYAVIAIPEENELLNIYRTLTPEGQRALMASARGIAATYSKNNKVPKAS